MFWGQGIVCTYPQNSNQPHFQQLLRSNRCKLSTFGDFFRIFGEILTVWLALRANVRMRMYVDMYTVGTMYIQQLSQLQYTYLYVEVFIFYVVLLDTLCAVSTVSSCAFAYNLYMFHSSTGCRHHKKGNVFDQVPVIGVADPCQIIQETAAILTIL